MGPLSISHLRFLPAHSCEAEEIGEEDAALLEDILTHAGLEHRSSYTPKGTRQAHEGLLGPIRVCFAVNVSMHGRLPLRSSSGLQC